MSDRLQPGTHLTTNNGHTLVVDSFLGAGGQGDVYKVRTPHGDMALKWYFAETATHEQKENLLQLCLIGHDDVRFLWPEDFVVEPNGPRFGYVMPLRPDGWANIPALLARKVDGATLRSIYAMGVGMAEAFRSLHTRGLAYRDISWGNVFFQPTSGQVLVCDNDNAVFANQDAQIDGTMKFMAPELVLGDGRPRVETDLHSLAVLLFMVFVNGHPLEGELEANVSCLDAEAERRLYGEHPVFIYDPSDHSNRPKPGVHDTVIAVWPTLPRRLQDLFKKAFGDGLKDPAQRVTEWTWIRELSRLHDSTTSCSSCGKLNVFDEETHKQTGVPGVCWKCQSTLSTPHRLVSGKRSIVLEPSVRLYEHHVRSDSDHDFTAAIAEMVAHPSKPGRFGLRNLGPYVWTTSTKDGETSTVPPSTVLRIRKDLSFEVGGTRFSVE